MAGRRASGDVARAGVSVSGAETLADCARRGLGIIQKPRYSAAADLAAGHLVEILAASPPPPSPVAIYFPRDRHLSPRVRAFIDWTTQVFRQATAS